MDQSLQHHCKMQNGPVGFRGLERYGGFPLGPSPLSGVHMWSLVSLREHCFTQGHMSRRSSVQCLFYIRVNVCNLFTLVTNRPIPLLCLILPTFGSVTFILRLSNTPHGSNKEFDSIQMKSARSPLPILATALLVTTARQVDH